MTPSLKKIVLSTLAVAGLSAAAIGSAQAGVFVYGAPAAVYVPTCHFVAVPFVNRQVCN